MKTKSAFKSARLPKFVLYLRLNGSCYVAIRSGYALTQQFHICQLNSHEGTNGFDLSVCESVPILCVSDEYKVRYQ